MEADKKKIWVRGQYVEVTDEVYTAYMQGDTGIESMDIGDLQKIIDNSVLLWSK